MQYERKVHQQEQEREDRERQLQVEQRERERQEQLREQRERQEQQVREQRERQEHLRERQEQLREEREQERRQRETERRKQQVREQDLSRVNLALDKNKIVATFYCCQTRLIAIPVQNQNGGGASRMQHPFCAYPAVFILCQTHFGSESVRRPIVASQGGPTE